MSYATQSFANRVKPVGQAKKHFYPFMLESDRFRWSVSNARHDPVVYIVRAENGLFKIGQTCSIVSRVSGLDSLSPIPIQFHHLILTNNAYELEKELHRRHESHWVRGEWFELPESDRKYLEMAARLDYREARYPGWRDYRHQPTQNYGQIEVARKEESL